MTARQTAPRQAEAAYSITEAAELKSVSPGFIRAAIRATGGKDPKTGRVVVPLRAKRVGKAYRIGASALDDWFSRLEDA
jgi:hypothetical protein